MLAPIEKLLFDILQVLYGVVHDYGFAIILLTVAIRVILLPLTIKQTKSMYELQRIQPKIKELQDKHKNDKEKLQEETLKFYQENKVNPFGGCLPMLLQMPIFFALFRMLGTAGETPGLFPQHIQTLSDSAAAAASRFWIILPDITLSAGQVYSSDGLTAAIPYLIFVLLFGASTLVPQLLQPGAQAQQKQMSYMMSAMMLFFGWSVSAGVVLYWVTQGLLGVIQQLIQTKLYKAREAQA
ncbi:MAG: YidC/Oxa1 family membrane protein insertase [Coriobacteriia bacterium]|nr:YidC/Oxa1 family membrane protein insertase [Coriobacteriia bacterium]MBN2841050.1 YidC/Oxa1 family membrane protein insertase [Coriobacteriia bacterium]